MEKAITEITTLVHNLFEQGSDFLIESKAHTNMASNKKFSAEVLKAIFNNPKTKKTWDTELYPILKRVDVLIEQTKDNTITFEDKDDLTILLTRRDMLVTEISDAIAPELESTIDTKFKNLLNDADKLLKDAQTAEGALFERIYKDFPTKSTILALADAYCTTVSLDGQSTEEPQAIVLKHVKLTNKNKDDKTNEVVAMLIEDLGEVRGIFKSITNEKNNLNYFATKEGFSHHKFDEVLDNPRAKFHTEYFFDNIKTVDKSVNDNYFAELLKISGLTQEQHDLKKGSTDLTIKEVTSKIK